MRKPEISVVIPALNEENYIMGSLGGLKKQAFRNFETIVVDGGSGDRTAEIAKKYAKVIIERKKGIARARNRGAVVAKGKIILFLDADTKPSRDLLAVYSKAFKDKNVVIATGPILPLEKSDFRMNLGYAFVSIFFVKLTIWLGRPNVVGSNFAVRKEAFDKVKGFNSSLMTYEDWDLSTRMKKLGKAIFLEDALVHTSVRRVREWGIGGFFRYHVGNMIRYNLFKRPKVNYAPIR